MVGIAENDFSADFIEIIEGDMDNVIGAPMSTVVSLLMENGLPANLIRK